MFVIAVATASLRPENTAAPSNPIIAALLPEYTAAPSDPMIAALRLEYTAAPSDPMIAALRPEYTAAPSDSMLAALPQQLDLLVLLVTARKTEITVESRFLATQMNVLIDRLDRIERSLTDREDRDSAGLQSLPLAPRSCPPLSYPPVSL